MVSDRFRGYVDRREIQTGERVEQGGVVRPIHEIGADVAEDLGSVGSQDEDGRTRHVSRLVPDVDRFDGVLSARIGEDGEGYGELGGHRRVLFGRVDDDGGDRRAASGELFISTGHLGQLAVTVRSPISPIKDEDDGSLAERVGEAP